MAGCACMETFYLDANGACVPIHNCTCFDDYTYTTKNAGDVTRRGCANW